MAPVTAQSELAEQPRVDTSVDSARTSAYATEFDRTYREILRATRWWVLYGAGGFAVICILVGAVEALFGR